MSEDATKITDLETAPAEAPAPEKKPRGKAAAAAKDAVDTGAITGETVEQELDPEVVAARRKYGGLPISGKLAEITVHTGEGEHGKFNADVQINGFRIRIKRNQKVIIPVEFLEVLQNSMRKTFSQQGHGQDQSVNTIPRFPLSVHRYL